MSTNEAVHIVIHCQAEGYSFELSTDMPAASIPAALRRLREYGIEPKQHTSGKRKPKTQPIYADDGTPMCPVHNKPLREGSFGPYCSAKAQGSEAANDKGYCAIKFDV